MSMQSYHIHPFHWDHTLYRASSAADAVSWAIGHNPAQVTTPTQDTLSNGSIIPAQAGTHFFKPQKDDRLSQPRPGINSTARQDSNSGP